jgi:hypothetical protein
MPPQQNIQKYDTGRCMMLFLSRRRTPADQRGRQKAAGEISFFLRLLMVPFLPVIVLFKLFFGRE